MHKKRFKRNRIPKEIRKFVRGLKWHQTVAERVCRSALRELEIPFKRQAPICVSGKWYIMDFHLPQHRLCIELDGFSHQNPKSQVYDALRDSRLRREGIRTVRIDDNLMHNVMQGMFLIRQAIRPPELAIQPKEILVVQP